MADPKTDDNRVDELAEEFACRWRAGERPAVEEYVARYPQWAEEIRAVLPAVVMMEQLKPRPADAATDRITIVPQAVPRQVGEYRIVREIGRGGMGVVYEAEQEALGRRVAIKVLPGSVLANSATRERFRREAQAAARLHHTNIVPVFGVGECDGQCFYVMQLITGRGLDQIIRSGEGRESLWWRTVARIGSGVADALACAHAQGILHRDVKPSNLLLDERGTVWVTDFGVAKLVEEANLTQSGDLVGTLKYMPPERFAGQTDARGDIYSLGATLYELLTLRSAFPDTTPYHLIHLITYDAPTPPRKLNPDIPRDLETIVLKAMSRFPSHRYQTPEELAEDLRRFLDDRPILARRIGPAERVWRWCRRNPALAAATAAVFLLMAAVTVVSVIGYAQTAAAKGRTEQALSAEAAAKEQTEQALSAEKAQREHAEDTSTLALEALNRVYNHFAPTRMVVAPQVSEAGVEVPSPPTLSPEAVPLLEALLRTYERVARDGREISRLQPQAAEANSRIGDICQRLGRLDDAATAYRESIDLYTRLLSDTSDDSLRIKLARSYNELGRTLRTRQQLDQANKMHERAIQTLNDAPREFARRPECRYELARSYFLRSQWDMLQAPGGRGPAGRGRRPPEWEREKGPPPERSRPPRGPGRGPPPRPDIQRAIGLLEPLVREFPLIPEYGHLLACCYREPPSNGKAKEAAALLRKLMKQFPRVPDYRLELCETLAQPGPPPRPGDVDEEANRQKGLDDAVALSKPLVEHYPNVPAFVAAHARYLDGLGRMRFRAGKYSEAEQLHRKAIAYQSKLVKLYPDVAAYTFWLGLMERSRGEALGELGQLPEARALVESGVRRVEGLWKKDASLSGARMFLGMAYRTLARVLTRAGEKELAATAERKAAEYGPERGRRGERRDMNPP
jgi:tetratricopeptide (TPR) repeat protein/predicted Ser/Thr protein kinase